jgi:hypothetical protein
VNATFRSVRERGLTPGSLSSILIKFNAERTVVTAVTDLRIVGPVVAA